jgi:soluble lytic murein transglycosylase
MRLRIRHLLPFPVLPVLVLTGLLLRAPAARAQDVMGFVRADQWEQAQQAAAAYADPVAGKLVTYYRLLAPNAASAGEIAAFIAKNPDWPQQALLARRYDEALANEPDDATAAALCTSRKPHLSGALARCANALAATGNSGAATDDARAAWRAGLASSPGFLDRGGSALTAADETARFDSLAWMHSGEARTEIPRLSPAAQAIAEARLAAARDDPRTAALLAALPGAAKSDPGLMLEAARWMRRNGQASDALAFWKNYGAAAQKAATPAHLPLFWGERNLLARNLLQQGDAAGAYALAAMPGQTGVEQVADAEFLAGFIALTRLNKPAEAAAHFRKLAEISGAAITQGRAWYWIGRANAAAGKDPKPDYTRSARWVTTYYGQLAALALGDTPAQLNARIDAVHDPAWTRDQVFAFADRELTRAAMLLVAWGEPRRAHAFLLRLEDVAPSDTVRALAARLALGLGMPDQAVMVARFAGRDGLMLPGLGWPLAADVPKGDVEPAVLLGLIRQESSFDPNALSPSGARGLMQLMPATARLVARQSGTPGVTLVSLTSDPDLNMRLGSAYFRTVLDQFGGVLPFAIAAYNAGPNRVQQWLADNGDPRLAGVSNQPDMIDWIELIPFGETRNYVQRVIENIVVYRARTGVVAPHPLAQWLK